MHLIIAVTPWLWPRGNSFHEKYLPLFAKNKRLLSTQWIAGACRISCAHRGWIMSAAEAEELAQKLEQGAAIKTETHRHTSYFVFFHFQIALGVWLSLEDVQSIT